jgi:hypothetical protein
MTLNKVILIGITTAIVAFFIDVGVDFFSGVKLQILQESIEQFNNVRK